MNYHVIKAILKRNFVSYFANPTGYVFIIVFVVLTSFATFWPNEFFNANLANLDQLNRWFPYIMLVFIPAITMSIWADERKQGTDELLLTIPAGDFDVVFGKYLASVAIFTVALVFSLFCNYFTLLRLGDPDLGLFVATYIGYWLVGIAMLAIGMVASFLTASVPIAFILGVLANAPLVLASITDIIPFLPGWASGVKYLSISEQLGDCARGVVSLSSMAYFVGIAAVMLYLAMVLIGRRHWRGEAQQEIKLPWHYAVRFLSLLATVIGVNLFLLHHDRLRADVTTEGLNSLSARTKNLIRGLQPKQDVHLYAYISKNLPETFARTKLNLLSTLREIDALGNPKLHIHVKPDLDIYSSEAVRAEQNYDIKPQRKVTRNHGVSSLEPVILGFAVESGPNRVKVPFLGQGIPVEYEVSRSIATVCQTERKTLGVLTTDVKLFAGFDMATMGTTSTEDIIEELKKQYDVVQVDPTKPITEKFAVLLAVQPSSLNPQQMENFAACVLSGQPTAIFEDPMPTQVNAPGTGAPKRAPGGMFGGGGPMPKGDIQRLLFKPLGIRIPPKDVVWQNYNPFPKTQDFIQREMIFVGKQSAGSSEPFNMRHEVTRKLQFVLFPFPGEIRDEGTMLTFNKLAVTGTDSGVIGYDDLLRSSPMGDVQMANEREIAAAEARSQKGSQHVLAVHLTGKLKPKKMKSTGEDEPEVASSQKSGEDAMKEILGDAAAGKDANVNSDTEINVAVVSDIDCLLSIFFRLRERGQDTEAEVDLDLDNVTFVLNLLDHLAGDERFIDIRNRRPQHRTLSAVENITQTSAKETDDQIKEAYKEVAKKKTEAEESLRKTAEEIDKRKDLTRAEKAEQMELARSNENTRLQRLAGELEKEVNNKLKSIKREQEVALGNEQDKYKAAAVFFPIIPPLLLAFIVYFNRRAKEREGISKARLR
jgi:ABC-2 type transport system permease protein